MRLPRLLAIPALCVGCMMASPPQTAAPPGPVVDTSMRARAVCAVSPSLPILPADSILLSTTNIELRVGQEYFLLELAPRILDTEGTVQRMGRWQFRFPPTEVFTVAGTRLRASQPGVAELYVHQLSEGAAPDPTRRFASTRVMVTVQP
jgi:hypothetical protein